MPDIDSARDRSLPSCAGLCEREGWPKGAKSPLWRLAKRYTDPVSFGRHSLPPFLVRRASFVRPAAGRMPCDPMVSARRCSRPGGPRDLITRAPSPRHF